MTNAEFMRLSTAFLADVRELTPINKNRKAPTRGNLRLRATRGKAIAHGRYSVTVSSVVAPYFPYVNYMQTFKSGKPNPNYQYLDDALKYAIENLARKAGGIVIYGKI